MNATRQRMEHRWGTRVCLDAPAQFVTLDGMSALGVIRNASVSGALADIPMRLAPLSRLRLRPLTGAGEWLDACVVRVDGRSIGLEWLDPPGDTLAMLQGSNSGNLPG